MGATIGGAFAMLLSAFHLPFAVNVPSFAMVGMGAMVGGGTGAVMTAIAMIFEMTRDYDIVLPMILAVAVSVGVRRLLSRENIYTLKLFRRGHVIPKALHANMFLVRRAKDVMETDVVLATTEMSFDAFLSRPDNNGRMRHVAVTEGNRIFGVLRVNTALRRTSPNEAQLQRDFAGHSHSQFHCRPRRRYRFRCYPTRLAKGMLRWHLSYVAVASHGRKTSSA